MKGQRFKTNGADDVALFDFVLPPWFESLRINLILTCCPDFIIYSFTWLILIYCTYLC